MLGGDGRFGNKQSIDVIVRMAAAHRVKKIITTVDGILSTPAASHLIRTEKAVGGIILSASHNSGGPDGDFGVKINGPNGGPASESLTDAIYAKTTKLDHYLILKNESIPLDNPGAYSISTTTIEVINGIDAYVELMQKIFDLDQIRDFLSNDFLMAFDALNAVTGPYAIRLFEGLLGMPSGTVRNGVPLEDFGAVSYTHLTLPTICSV